MIQSSDALKGVVSPLIVPIAATVEEGAGGAVPVIAIIATAAAACRRSINHFLEKTLRPFVLFSSLLSSQGVE
jgi:hypothetical protein